MASAATSKILRAPGEGMLASSHSPSVMASHSAALGAVQGAATGTSAAMGSNPPMPFRIACWKSGLSERPGTAGYVERWPPA